MYAEGRNGEVRRNARFVVVSLCTDPIEELTARAEVEAEVEVMGGLAQGMAGERENTV